MMAVAAAQKNREMFAMKKSYSIEVSFMNLSICFSRFNFRQILNVKRLTEVSRVNFN